MKRPEPCPVCGKRKNLQRHHINPKRNGGSNSFHNIFKLCGACHKKLEKYIREHEPEVYRRLLHDFLIVEKYKERDSCNY